MKACTGAEGGEGIRQGSEPPPAAASPSIVLQPEDADRLWVFADSADDLGAGGEFRIYVDPVRFREALASFAEFGLGAGGALPVHRHDKTEEIAYFLSGSGAVTVYHEGEPEEIAVGPGSVVYTPPGSWHAIANTGDEPLRLVFAAVPNEKKGLLSFFRRIGVRPGQQATPLSPDEFARIAAEHDLILRPPEPDG